MQSRERTTKLYFLLTSWEWFVLLCTTMAVVASIAAFRADVTLWPALGLSLTVVVVGHLCFTAERHVAFPDLVALASCLQWIVAPWLASSYPPHLPVFQMSLPADEYLKYAVPATLALYIGLYLPVHVRLSEQWIEHEIAPLSRRVRFSLDAMILAGLILDIYVDSVPIQWTFLAYLIASLRFFGALSWMVTRTPGWWIRVGAVLFELLAMQSRGGLFYLVVHWSGYFLLVYAFMSRWRWKLVVTLLVGTLGLGLLQDVKPTFRQSLARHEVNGPLEPVSKLVSLMWDRLNGADVSVSAEQTDFGDQLVRFNQGWIISRVMTHVPKEEPYASGRTLTDAALFSIVPRFMFPSKRQGTSNELFRKYTGVDLAYGTKMGLGLIGELYANFSFLGGISATFLYGCVVGYLFMLFAERGLWNPLWWAAASTILLPSVEPGFNIEDILNHVVKAAVVFFVIWKLLPAMQRLLAVTPDLSAGELDEASFGDAVADR